MASDSARRWWVLGAMGAILGVILLDETVVGVALQSIDNDLGLTTLEAHWIVNIYLLVLAGLALAAGRLADSVGYRSLMALGLVLFGLSSAVAGFATSGTMLIVARAVQGIGAAVIFPLSLVLVSMSFEEKDRGMALGLYGTIGTSFLALGPVVGGVLTDTLSWRWIFWINPPIVLAIVAVTLVFWRDPPHRPEPRFDWAGLVLMVAGIALLVFGIMEGPERGWTDPEVYLSISLGIICLIALVPVSLRQEKPLIAVGLFRNPTFTGANLVVFLAQYIKIATFVFGATYFQEILKMSPLMSGVALLPAVVPPILMAVVAGRASDRYGVRLPALIGVFGAATGLLITAGGVAFGIFSVTLIGLLFWGLLVSFMFVPTQRAVMTAVPDGMQGQAGGIVLTSQLLGGTIGMAICSTLFSETGAYSVVFFGASLLAFAIFVVGYFTLDRETGAGGPVEVKT